MALDKAAVAHIARLARIKVAPESVEPLAAELGHLLTWVEQLNEVDVGQVEPMTSGTARALPLRADVVTDGACAQKILSNAPGGAAQGFFVVPKVVE